MAGGPLPIISSRMGCLLDALDHAYRVLGLDGAAGEDEVFCALVLARIIEPATKLDSLRVTGQSPTLSDCALRLSPPGNTPLKNAT